MSHRKFRAPRHGSLAFLPRKRCRTQRGRIKAFPKDNPAAKPHLTAFAGYKVGMTHVVRDVDKLGSKLHKREVVEGVTVLDTPPMYVVGVVGYVETPKGLRTLTTVWAEHLGEQAKRRLYKGWTRSKKKAFTKYQAKLAEGKEKKLDDELARIKKYCSIVRVIAHTDVSKIKSLQRKMAHVQEIQINGGANVGDKVDFAASLLEKAVPVSAVFEKDEMVDVVGVSRGHGFQGVVQRWGVTKLARKTHRGLRKVACIGAWHPAKVSTTVARGGQMGNHHRVERNKKIYRVGDGDKADNATTDQDLTAKKITPLGGFTNYGVVDNDFLLIKGGVVGPRKKFVAIRKTLVPQTFRDALETVNIKLIDTTSKSGHGKYQTVAEKKKAYGTTKSGLYAAK